MHEKTNIQGIKSASSLHDHIWLRLFPVQSDGVFWLALYHSSIRWIIKTGSACTPDEKINITPYVKGKKWTV